VQQEQKSPDWFQQDDLLPSESKTFQKTKRIVLERTAVLWEIGRLFSFRIATFISPRIFWCIQDFFPYNFYHIGFGLHYEFKSIQKKEDGTFSYFFTKKAYRPIFETQVEVLCSVPIFQTEKGKWEESQKEFLQSQSARDFSIVKQKMEQQKTLWNQKTKCAWILAFEAKQRMVRIASVEFYGVVEFTLDDTVQWGNVQAGVGGTHFFNFAYPWEFRFPSLFISIKKIFIFNSFSVEENGSLIERNCQKIKNNFSTPNR
jgi:hypothetical protein